MPGRWQISVSSATRRTLTAPGGPRGVGVQGAREIDAAGAGGKPSHSLATRKSGRAKHAMTSFRQPEEFRFGHVHAAGDPDSFGQGVEGLEALPMRRLRRLARAWATIDR